MIDNYFITYSQGENDHDGSKSAKMNSYCCVDDAEQHDVGPQHLKCAVN